VLSIIGMDLFAFTDP